MKSKKTYLWLWHVVKNQIPLLILLSLSSIAASVAYIGLALVSRRAVNIAAAAPSLGSVKGELISCGIWLASIIIGQLVLALLNSHIRAVIGGKLQIRMRRQFFETVMSKEYAEINQIHSGELLNRFTSDIDIVVNGVTGFIPQALSIFAKIIAGLVVIAAINSRFTVVIVCTGLVVMAGALAFSPIYKKLHKSVQKASGEMRSFSQECMENTVVIKSFSSKIPLLKKLEESLKNVYKKMLLRNHISNAASGGVMLIFTSLYYVTLLWGAMEIAAGTMDYGTLTAFLQIVSQIRTPFFNASGLITQLYGAVASAERIIEIEELTDEPPASDSAAGLYENLISIKAEHLCFGYDGKSVIENSTFRLKKGGIISVTGASGAGKSTLFRLLLGLYRPVSGTLALETGDGEYPIDASMRPLFAYVPQGNLVLSGTIRENITFGVPDADDSRIMAAVETACLSEFVRTLPDGLNTVLGERGLGLSEGQIQRISIARALFSDAPVLLLDECTSALDEQTESRLLDNIAKLKTKTVLFISHRNTTLSICDTHLKIENRRFFLSENISEI